MAKLYISEYTSIDFSYGGVVRIPVGQEPSAVDQVVDFISGVATSSAFSASTEMVRVWSDTQCSIKFGSDPTATTGNKPLSAGAPEYFGVNGGSKLSVVSNT